VSPYYLVYRTWSACIQSNAAGICSGPAIVPTVVCKTGLHTKNLMEKIMHLCFTSWCTEGVSALKVSQDSTHNFLTSRQTVWLLRHSGCRTRLAGDWSPDTTFTCWQDVHETDCLILRQTIWLQDRLCAGQGSHWEEILRQTVWLWDRLSDFETECKEGVKTTKVLQDSRHNFHMLAGCAWDRLSQREKDTRAQPSTFAARLWGFCHCEVCPKAGPTK